MNVKGEIVEDYPDIADDARIRLAANTDANKGCYFIGVGCLVIALAVLLLAVFVIVKGLFYV